MNRNPKLYALLMCITLCGVARADEPLPFPTDEVAASYHQLIKEIRCITCPNQNIAESDGGVASAIKAEVYSRLVQGESAEYIRQDLIVSYGDQIVYRPQWNKQNSLLWFMPAALALVGFGAWRRMHARSSKAR